MRVLHSLAAFGVAGQMLGGAAAAAADMQSFTDKQVRPVPGYTLACRKIAEDEAGRDRRIRGEVVAVLADGDGSRLRALRNDREGLVAEVEMRFDAMGALVGEPTVKRDGKVDTSAQGARLAVAARKVATESVYTGRALSSGDAFTIPYEIAEIQALVDRFWPKPAHIAQYAEAGHVVGLREHPTFGTVMVVERVARGVLKDDDESLTLSARIVESYALASGLPVAMQSRATIGGEAATIRATETSDCRYTATPDGTPPGKQAAATAR
jgi:hypothetical protein